MLYTITKGQTLYKIKYNAKTNEYLFFKKSKEIGKVKYDNSLYRLARKIYDNCIFVKGQPIVVNWETHRPLFEKMISHPVYKDYERIRGQINGNC